jgi:hypothetical protein
MNEQQAYFVDTPWTWRERLRFKLFPSRHCSLPEAPVTYLDCVVSTTRAEFSFLDRLRILLTGKCVVQTKTVCQNVVGETRTSSVAYPVLK